MAHQVLAQQWRPQQFSDVIGQEPVVRALQNALTQQRLHHAYLFTGTRGVGKTTLARLLAKCLNCEQGISATPCDQCNSCKTVQTGTAVDVIEVDAASRTKVEDTRELLDNVQYAPTQHRYKIYLIDEVHMLSKHSFNALLKTLEEPPKHVKFLLATTDPKKLPLTVLSRCLHFHMKTVALPLLTKHLAHILTQLNIDFEPAALTPIAQAAQGSVRDSLSLLEQAIAYAGNHLETTQVNELLGVVAFQSIATLLRAIKAQDGLQLLKTIRQLAEAGSDFSVVLKELLHVVHQLAVLHIIPTAYEDDDNSDALTTLADFFSAEILQLYYQIALQGQRDLPLAPSPQLGFEMIMLRLLAFSPMTTAPLDTHISAARTTPTPAQTSATITTPPAPPQTTSAPLETKTSSDWITLVPQLKLKGAALLLANQCQLVDLNEHTATLQLAQSQAALLTPNSQQRLNDALSAYLGRPLTTQIQAHQSVQNSPAKQQQQQQSAEKKQAKQHLTNDPKLQSLIKNFDATLLPDTLQLNEPIE